MRPEKRVPVHPGEVLLEEFLRPLGLTQVAFAEHVGISLQRVNEIVKGKRGVTPETAWLLSQALSTTPEFWLNLQSAHDLAKTRPGRKIRPVSRRGVAERRRARRS
jgi:antitoxin HigA-1